MHVFLFLGFIIAVLLLLFLYLLDDIKMIKRKVPKDKRFGLMKRSVFLKILICASVLLFVSRVLPFFIWTFGTKDMCETEKVLTKNKMYQLSQNDSKYYVGEGELEGTKYFVVNVSEKSVLYDTIKEENVKVLPTGKREVPRYEIVGIYKIRKLKSNNIFCQAANDMYANIYLQSMDAVKEEDDKKAKKKSDVVYLSQKIVIYAPEDSIKKDFKIEKK